jgi:hypothetical protein
MKPVEETPTVTCSSSGTTMTVTDVREVDERVLVSARDGSFGRALGHLVERRSAHVVQMGGKQLAAAMMLAQFPIGPRLQPEAGPREPKLSSRERRFAKINAGRLKVVDGRLVGA